MAEAIPQFREKVLVPGRWDPAKGASLKTFFVGQCLIRFVGVMNRWLNNERLKEDLAPEQDADRTWYDRSARADVERIVIADLAAASALAEVPRVAAREALAMRSRGYTNKEIAKHQGVTNKAVERMLTTAKEQVKKRTEGTA